MVKFQPAGNANRFGVMRFNVKFQDVRVLEYVFAPWTAHLNIVMNPHVDVEKIRVFKLLVACAALEHVARGILVLFDFVDLERTRGGEALATVRAHPHSEKRKSQGSVSVQKKKNRQHFKQYFSLRKVAMVLPFLFIPFAVKQSNSGKVKRGEGVRQRGTRTVYSHFSHSW